MIRESISIPIPIQKKTRIPTKRLTLRPYSQQDVPALTELLTDPEITKTFMVPEFTSPEQAEALAKKLVAFSQPEDTAHLEYGIALDGKLIGFLNDCGVTGDEIEIGYVIHPAYQGRGYATEALEAVLGELREMGFRAVTAGYFSENTASRRVMEKCGMTHTDVTDEEFYRGRTHLCRYCRIVLSDSPADRF